MEEQLSKLKKELEETKKELADYKRKEEEDKIVDIPEEEVDLPPLKCMSFVGGISSRVRLINTTSSEWFLIDDIYYLHQNFLLPV